MLRLTPGILLLSIFVLALATVANAGCKVPQNASSLTATAVSPTQISLTWMDNSTNPDEEGFRIERKTGQSGAWEVLDITPGDTSKGHQEYYADTTCSPNTEYCYQIIAFNACGDANPCPTKCATTPSGGGQPPAAPSNLGATAVSETRIGLAWTDNANNETGFLIQRKTGAGGTFGDLNTVGANVATYQDTTCSPGTTYCYRVRAYNGYGDSAWSNEASATTPSSPGPPAAPTNLSATVASSTSVDLAWTDNSGNETGFKIEVDEGNTGVFAYLNTVGADVTTYTDSGLTTGTTYCYRVYAYNGYGNSSYSNVACATPQSGQVVTVSTVAELQAAVNAATPGTVIALTDGTYNLTNVDGIMIQDKNDLTIRSQSGNREAVIVKGQGISDRAIWFCFKLYRSDYITIENMTLRDVYWHCVQINEGSSNYVLRNLYMWDAGEGPVKTTVLPSVLDLYCDDGLVENCVIGYTTGGKRSVVEGIDLIASARTVIRNCDFYNAKANKQAGYGFFAKGNAEDTVVDNCYFQDCDIALSFGDGLCPWDYSRYLDDSQEHRRGIMKNNVVHLTSDVGIYLVQSVDFKCYNNTVWSTYGSGSSIDFRYTQTSGTCYNNICSQGYRFRDGATATLSNNIWNAPAALFVNQAGGDYHLVSTATQAINQGLDTTADVPYDMDGETRPKGSAVDIGADEY